MPQAAVSERRLVPLESIQRMILVVRGRKVLVDVDLAAIYGRIARVLLTCTDQYGLRRPYTTGSAPHAPGRTRIRNQ